MPYDMGNAYDEMGVRFSLFDCEQEAIRDVCQYEGERNPLFTKILGDIALKKGDKQRALREYKQCLQIAVSNNERRAISFAYNKIAAYYKDQDQPDSAIYYANKGLQESKAIGKKLTGMEAAGLLSEL